MNSIQQKLAGYGLSAALILAGGTLVAPFEGKSNTAYKDVGGVWTQCYGNTQNIDRAHAKSDGECTKELAEELEVHDRAMIKYVKVDLTDYQEAAFTSFVYNVGVGSWSKSTALKLLNQKKYTEACQQLMRWNKVNGEPYAGLTRRRTQEVEVCLGNNKQAIEEAERVYNTFKNSDLVDIQKGER
jgi:lysozyme